MIGGLALASLINFRNGLVSLSCRRFCVEMMIVITMSRDGWRQRQQQQGGR